MADVSVRPARAGDAAVVAELTLGSWREAYGALLATTELPDPASATARWRDAIDEPGQNRLLVACAGSQVVGYATAGPSEDPGGEIGQLVVATGARRQGHGSRLLAAAVAYLREDGFTYALTWVADGDPARATFLQSAGFAPDPVARVLDLDGTGAVTVRQRRFSALLA